MATVSLQDMAVLSLTRAHMLIIFPTRSLISGLMSKWLILVSSGIPIICTVTGAGSIHDKVIHLPQT